MIINIFFLMKKLYKLSVKFSSFCFVDYYYSIDYYNYDKCYNNTNSINKNSH